MGKPGQFTLTKANLRGRNRNGGRAFAQVRKVNIEGEMLTMVEISQRLGCEINSLRKRYERAKALPGPITWERLLPKHKVPK